MNRQTRPTLATTYGTYPLASFGARLAAALLDLTILPVLTLLADFLVGKLVDLTSTKSDAAFWLAAPFVYTIIFRGITPGKQIMHLDIVQRNGQPISFTTALLRGGITFPVFTGITVLEYVFDPGPKGGIVSGYFIFIWPLSTLLYILLCLLPTLVTPDRQAIHDLICGTVVVYKRRTQ